MSDTLDYIAVKPCGCMAIWMSADNHRSEIAKEMARAIQDGLSVQRCTTEEARKWQIRCATCRPGTPLFDGVTQDATRGGKGE